MLRLVGETADGAILGDVATPRGIGAALEHIRQGARRAGRSNHKLAQNAVGVALPDLREEGLDSVSVRVWQEAIPPIDTVCQAVTKGE